VGPDPVLVVFPPFSLLSVLFFFDFSAVDGEGETFLFFNAVFFFP
jgi:hypothetical protein